MTTIALENAQPDLAALVARARASGEEILLTEADQPAAKLVPLLSTPHPPETEKKRRAGCLKGKIWMSPDFDEPLEDFKEYME